MVWDKCVSLETAKMLKEAGFNLECMSYYQHGIFYQYSVDRDRIVLCDCNAAPAYMDQYSAPTLATAQRWLQQVHYIEVYGCKNFFPNEKETANTYGAFIGNIGVECIALYPDYDSALEAGIQYALNIIIKGLPFA